MRHGSGQRRERSSPPEPSAGRYVGRRPPPCSPDAIGDAKLKQPGTITYRSDGSALWQTETNQIDTVVRFARRSGGGLPGTKRLRPAVATLDRHVPTAISAPQLVDRGPPPGRQVALKHVHAALGR